MSLRWTLTLMALAVALAVVANAAGLLQPSGLAL